MGRPIIICSQCHRPKPDDEYYLRKDGTRLAFCKDCISIQMDIFKPETYTWILKECDVPYVAQEWNVIRDRMFLQNPDKINGTSVLGKYLAKMKLKKWKEYTWADSEMLQEQYGPVIPTSEEEIKRLKEDRALGFISDSEYRAKVGVDIIHQEDMELRAAAARNGDYKMATSPDTLEAPMPFHADKLMSEMAGELTLNQKKQLILKWGNTFTLEELIKLERDYSDMEASFAIDDADTAKNLILLCKTNLNAEKALDSGDIDAFTKLMAVQDKIRKSSKFTAIQNKEGKNGIFDCAGQLVEYAEKAMGPIERFRTEMPIDKADYVLKDQQAFIANIVRNDLHFADDIDAMLRRIEEARIEAIRSEKEIDSISTSDETEEDDNDFISIDSPEVSAERHTTEDEPNV